MNETRFSIIIPIYNTKIEYLEAALKSALSQEYDNYEVIAVNDGSDEFTSLYLSRLEYNRLVLINQNNQGQFKSRINALKRSSGEYIVFFDSDDILDSKALQTLNSIIIASKTDVVMFPLPRFDNSIEHINNVIHYFDEGAIQKKDVLEQIANFHSCNICSKCAKKELLLRTNLNCEFKYGEDLIQAAELIMNANSYYYTYKTLYYYRINHETRDYYKISDVNYINYIASVYHVIFDDNNNSDLLQTYKIAAANAISFCALGICKLSKETKFKKEKLEELNKQEATIITKGLKTKMPIVSFILFNLVINNRYHLLTAISYLYDLIYGFDEVILK